MQYPLKCFSHSIGKGLKPIAMDMSVSLQDFRKESKLSKRRGSRKRTKND